MSYDSHDHENDTKTFRIGMMLLTVIIIALMVFLAKTEACKIGPSTCKEEYYDLDVDGRSNHTCDQGARAEIVGPPLYAKRGVICHCINVPAATSASTEQK